MIRAFVILTVGTLFLSALLTPAVYSGLVYLAGEFPWPFSRVFDRVAMIAAAILLFAYRKEFNLSELKKYFARRPVLQIVRDLGIGFLLSLVPALVALTFVVGGGELVWAEKAGAALLRRLPSVLFTAVVVSAIEEPFFRVILFNKLKSRLKPLAAAALCSIIYAFVHFIAPVKDFAYTEFSWTAGFSYLGAVAERLLLPGIPPAMFGLFCVGMILCFVITKTRSVFLCIGMHAGWVAALKGGLFTTTEVPGFRFASGIGRRYFLVAEPHAWASFLVIGLVLIVLLPRIYPAGSAVQGRG